LIDDICSAAWLLNPIAVKTLKPYAEGSNSKPGDEFF